MLDLLLSKAEMLNIADNPVIYALLSTVAARMNDKIGALDLAKLAFDVMDTETTSLSEKATSYELLSEALLKIDVKSTSYNLLKLAISMSRRISDIKTRFVLNLFASYLALEHKDENTAKNLMTSASFLLQALHHKKYSYETFLLHTAKLYVIYGLPWLETLIRKTLVDLKGEKRKILPLAVFRSLIISMSPSVIQSQPFKSILNILLGDFDRDLIYDFALAYSLAASIFKSKGDKQTYNQLILRSKNLLSSIHDEIERTIAKLSLLYDYAIDRDLQGVKSILDDVENAIRKKAEILSKKITSLSSEKIKKEIEKLEDAMIDYVFLVSRVSRLLGDANILRKAEKMAYNLLVPTNRVRMILEVALGYAWLKRPNETKRLLNDALRIISYEPVKLPSISALILTLGRIIALNPNLIVDCLQVFDLSCEYVDEINYGTLYMAFLTEITNELRRLEGTGVEFIPILGKPDEPEPHAG